MGGGLVIVRELLQPGLRGNGVIAHHLGTIPLASIPYIETPAEVARQQRLRRMALAAFAAMPVLAAVLVHFLVLPLDLLYYELLRRSGIG